MNTTTLSAISSIVDIINLTANDTMVAFRFSQDFLPRRSLEDGHLGNQSYREAPHWPLIP